MKNYLRWSLRQLYLVLFWPTQFQRNASGSKGARYLSGIILGIIFLFVLGIVSFTFSPNKTVERFMLKPSSAAALTLVLAVDCAALGVIISFVVGLLRKKKFSLTAEVINGAVSGAVSGVIASIITVAGKLMLDTIIIALLGVTRDVEGRLVGSAAIGIALGIILSTTYRSVDSTSRGITLGVTGGALLGVLLGTI